MINFMKGDILKAKTEAVVNTVNCVGVMGRGIALQFKTHYPENFKAYAKECALKKIVPGKMFVHCTGELLAPQYIINFPTKRHWRDKSNIEDIELGLIDLVEVINTYSITSIAIPPLGCGLGGLEWNNVKPMIIRYLGSLSHVDVIAYEPSNITSELSIVKLKQFPPPLTIGRATLISSMAMYKSAHLDPIISLLEIHKLMYFAQESGLNLKLNYAEGPYGPFAQNLRHVLLHMEGHYTSGYGYDGDNPKHIISLLPGAEERAEQELHKHPSTKRHIDRIKDTIDGFESPLGLELLATVHWIMTKQGIVEIDAIVEAMYEWNAHKSMFTQRQIQIAEQTLRKFHWV
jgi:O-acetyl-ADP-ribose deacetylase (regulator of RNase III)